jgi:hypothetical protein
MSMTFKFDTSSYEEKEQERHSSMFLNFFLIGLLFTANGDRLVEQIYCQEFPDNSRVI